MSSQWNARLLESYSMVPIRKRQFYAIIYIQNYRYDLPQFFCIFLLLLSESRFLIRKLSLAINNLTMRIIAATPDTVWAL